MSLVSLGLFPCYCQWLQMATNPRKVNGTACKPKPLCIHFQLLGVIEYFERSRYVKMGIQLEPFRNDPFPSFSFQIYLMPWLWTLPTPLIILVTHPSYKRHMVSTRQMTLGLACFSSSNYYRFLCFVLVLLPGVPPSTDFPGHSH